MSIASAQLSRTIDQLQLAVTSATASAKTESYRAIEVESRIVGKSASGSWLGYQARIYWKDFSPPPAGIHFSIEQGLRAHPWAAPHPNWIEYDASLVREKILGERGELLLSEARATASDLTTVFDRSKNEALAVVASLQGGNTSRFVESVADDLQKLTIPTLVEIVNSHAPHRKFVTSDTLAMNQGTIAPAWVNVMAEAMLPRAALEECQSLLALLRKLETFLNLQASNDERKSRMGVNVFIGHGRSPVWRDLKDFLQERLKLSYDEFNRVPIAGVTNTDRLKQMLDAAAVALIVMTAEDEAKDGKIQARMNVIHEVGLFQGRLGFDRAIVLLEEGCEEFSNINGLGQIRFPKGNIGAKFEDIRQFLEREGLIK